MSPGLRHPVIICYSSLRKCMHVGTNGLFFSMKSMHEATRVFKRETLLHIQQRLLSIHLLLSNNLMGVHVHSSNGFWVYLYMEIQRWFYIPPKPGKIEQKRTKQKTHILKVDQKMQPRLVCFSLSFSLALLYYFAFIAPQNGKRKFESFYTMNYKSSV